MCVYTPYVAQDIIYLHNKFMQFMQFYFTVVLCSVRGMLLNNISVLSFQKYIL